MLGIITVVTEFLLGPFGTYFWLSFVTHLIATLWLCVVFVSNIKRSVAKKESKNKKIARLEAELKAEKAKNSK